MIDRQLAHAETAGGGQHRHEAVQFAVQPHLGEHLAAITFHAAVVVVQTDAGEPADQPVEDARGQHLVPGIVAHLLPAADDVAVSFHRGQEPRDLARVVLQVGVERHDQFAAGGAEAGAQRRRLAEIPAKANSSHARIGFDQPPHLRPRAVGRAVVDEDNLDVIPFGLGHGDKLGMERRQAIGFVEQRYDGGKLHLIILDRTAW